MKYFNTTFFKLSTELFFAIDTNNKFVELSGNWEKCLGISQESFLSQPLIDFMHPQDGPMVLSSIEKLNNTHDRAEVKIRFKTKDDSYKHINCSLVFDIKNKIVLGSGREMSASLETSFYKSTLDHLPSLVSFLDKNLTYVYINDTYRKYFEIKDSDFIGKNISELMNFQLHVMLFPYLENALEGVPQTIELILPDSKIKSSYKIVNIDLLPYHNEKNEFEGIYSIIHDITELKTSATMAIEKEKKLNALFNSLTQGVVLQDAKGKIVEFNESALNILKLTKNQLLGKTSFDPYWRVVNEDHTPMPGEEHPAVIALRTGLPVIGKILGVYTTATDLSWMSVTAIPLISNSETLPNGALVTFEDLTKTKKLKQELRAKIHWQEAMLNGAEYLILSTNLEGKIVSFNKKAEQVLGYKSQEVINKFTPIAFHLDEEIAIESKKLSLEFNRPICPDFEVLITRALFSENKNAQWTYISKSQVKIPVKVYITPLHDNDNVCIGYLSIAELMLFQNP
jgi:PAS domain S-box-containing protein